MFTIITLCKNLKETLRFSYPLIENVFYLDKFTKKFFDIFTLSKILKKFNFDKVSNFYVNNYLA